MNLKNNISEMNTSIALKCCTLHIVWARWLKRQGVWLRAGRPGFDPGCRRGGDFSSLLHVQTGPGVQSASYKMSTGGGGTAMNTSINMGTTQQGSFHIIHSPY